MCNGDPKALSWVLPELRNRYAGLRRSITEIERKWPTLRTRGDVEKIRLQFEDAWKKTVNREQQSSVRRLFYGLISVATSPVKLMEAVLKGVETAEILGQLSSRVRGLHDFCYDLLNEPRQGANTASIQSLFPRSKINSQTWSLGLELSKIINSKLHASW